MNHGKQNMSPPGKKISPEKLRRDPGLRMQEYLAKSTSPEETLFKINELLFDGQGENIRKHARAPISVNVVFPLGGAKHYSTTYTLSQKGAFIKYPEPPPRGTAFELELLLEDGFPSIFVTAEVVQSETLEQALKRASLSGMSVVFTKIGREEKRRIDRVVRQSLKKMGKKPA